MKKLIFFLSLILSCEAVFPAFPSSSENGIEINLKGISPEKTYAKEIGQKETIRNSSEIQNTEALLFKGLSDIDSKLEAVKSVWFDKSEILSHMIKLNWTLLGLASASMLCAITTVVFCVASSVK